jgi:MFS family permease
MATSSSKQPNGTASETSPLLGKSNTTDQEHGSVERQDQDAADTADSDTPVPKEPTTGELLLIMGPCYFGSFLASLDSTIVATLSAPISDEFHSFTLLSWLASAYLISNAATQPISGRLTDIYGRRNGLLVAFLFFAAGNLICGLAKNEGVMILGRVVAGLGGGCMNTISVFIGSDLVPLRRRGLWQGFGNLAFGLGSGIGGVFGGWLHDGIGWRYAFLLQVPAVLLAGVIVYFRVNIPIKDTGKDRIKRVDFLGAFTLVTALVLLLLGLNSGGNIVPWDHPLVYVSLPLSALFFAGFVYIEDKIAAEPVIPVRLLLNRTVASACLTNWFLSMACFSYLYFVPVYFQTRGYSATAAGVRLIPASFGTAIGSLGSGYLMKRTGKYYWLSVAMMVDFVLAIALMAAFLNLNIPEWPPFIFLFMAGLAYGAMLTITLLALISAVGHEHQAVITSASYAFRSTGSTLGITIVSAVFQNMLASRLSTRIGDKPGSADIIQRVRDSIGAIKHLSPYWKGGVLDAYMDALRGVWLTTLGMTVLGAASSLFMRENVLHTNLQRK